MPYSIINYLNCDHYLVVDLEATCCDRKTIPSSRREIIEIGAVMLDRAGDPVSEFQTFVRPVRFPDLTPFCTELTTITQSEVEAAPLYPDAIQAFQAWIDAYRNRVFCAWGDFDRRQIRQDCKFHQVPNPIDLTCLNVKTMFARSQDLPGTYGMSQALDLAKIPLVGTHHRGIDDARNIAKLLPFALGQRRISTA
jgi:inhibitor of KinA sporulation pathway (predicted exonuclease)